VKVLLNKTIRISKEELLEILRMQTGDWPVDATINLETVADEKTICNLREADCEVVIRWIEHSDNKPKKPVAYRGGVIQT